MSSTSIVGVLSGIVPVVAAFGGVVWYSATLDGRITHLETQALTVAPSISTAIAPACADLANHYVADVLQGHDDNAAKKAANMHALGCLPAAFK